MAHSSTLRAAAPPADEEEGVLWLVQPLDRERVAVSSLLAGMEAKTVERDASGRRVAALHDTIRRSTALSSCGAMTIEFSSVTSTIDQHSIASQHSFRRARSAVSMLLTLCRHDRFTLSLAGYGGWVLRNQRWSP